MLKVQRQNTNIKMPFFQKFVDKAQPLHIKQAFLPIFEFSLKVKVMGSNPGYLLNSFLLYFLCLMILYFLGVNFTMILLNSWQDLQFGCLFLRFFFPALFNYFLA